MNVTQCDLGPCFNNATCLIDDRGDYHCKCPPGFTNKNCSEKTTPTACSSQPCENGGTCSVGKNGDYECYCAAGFGGPKCESSEKEEEEMELQDLVIHNLA